MRQQSSIIEYITASFLMHLTATLVLISAAPEVNTLSKIEVNIVEPPKIQKMAPPAQSPPKPLKSGRPGSDAPILPGEGKKTLETYAEELKAIVDPVWYVKLRPILHTMDRVYTTNVLLFPDKYGNIVSVKVVGSSGRRDLDQIALDTFRSIGKIPKPPEALVKEGILWDFSVSETM